MTFSVGFRLLSMRIRNSCIVLLLSSGVLQPRAATQTASPGAQVRLDSLSALEVINGKAEMVAYQGHQALHLMPLPGNESGDSSELAILKSSDLKDGVIEIDVAGSPRPGSDPSSRGFIGVSFRVQPHGSAYELIYLRPTNGRASNQLNRNHSTQYISEPDYGWERLRKETPGVYESYVDLEPGVWTKMKIEVSGATARLYVNGATQPTLIVNDLKRGESHGQIALWAHESTEAYFANLSFH
jgi:hypothetical protein